MNRFTLLPAILMLALFTGRAEAFDRFVEVGEPSECSADSVVRALEGTMCCFSFHEVKRPVTQVYMLEAGGTSALDTYLSPVRYHGYNLSLAGSWSKRLPWGGNSWQMTFDADAGFSRMLNPAKNALMLGFDASFAWGAAWTRTIDAGVSFTAGGSVSAECGVLYLTRNSNNPASAKAALSIAATASASYPFRIGRLPVRVSDRVSLPSLSVFFSPQYGETYYEIYLGNRSGLAHFGWWGNRFCIDNLLAFDLDIGPSALRLGYRYTLRSSWTNSLNTQIQSHSFVVGWIPHGIGLHRNAPSPEAISIYSL